MRRRSRSRSCQRVASRGLLEWNGHRFYHRGDGWQAGRVSGSYPRAADSRRIGPGCRARHSGCAATGGNTMGLDLLIRNGTIVDGSGAARYQGDVGIRQGQIVEIGRIRAGAERVIDADGLIVAPGFVDGHTHMDAQVAWDRIGSCSCWHGVTTVIMGNCGFALAPCRPEEREWFARCLTAVEDIPTESMLAGIDWTWETFPEYLATVDRLPKAINYGAYIGHSALRMYVMGKRALSETATDADLARMAGAVKEAIRAGAMGFSSSRATTHVTPDNTPVASRIADWAEVDRLVGAMGELGAGIFQVGPDISGGLAQRAFLARLQRVAVESGRPVMFGTIASRQGDDPNPWTYQLEYLDQCAAAGARVWGQTTTRSINAIFSLKSYLPFDVLPAWRELRRLPLPEQKRRLADPATRRQLMAEEATMKPRDNVFQGGGAATTDPRRPDYGNLYAMKDVNWNDPTVAQLAAAQGQHPVEVMIDLALENENQVFVQPLVNEHPDQVLGMLKHPRTLATFSDSGAHVCQEMGSSLQTHMLSYWVRAKQAFTLEEAVRKLTFDNASAWDITDRGLLRAGYRADLVLFDEARVQPAMPTVEADLPGGARRLVQKAEGIAATIVNGEVTLEHGKPTGRLPGALLRGPGARPA
ncbi:MAG: D-aminoacylase [Actinobacteria bacterium]|nr:MAG: D-aminoacylase [Actinomycetota bacterium]